VNALLRRLLDIGVAPGDDEDTRLRKFLLLVTTLAIMPLSLVWGAVYWAVGATTAALIPWLYVVIALIGLGAFALTRSYRWFAISQFAPYMTLPFVLGWVLEGPASSGGVALWAALGPIVALLLGHRRAATRLAGAYAALMIASALVPTPGGNSIPDEARQGFILLNLTVIPLLAWGLVRVASGGREGSLAAVRGLVQRYFSPALAELLLRDPGRVELGGHIAEVTVLFADLGSYSTYAEKRAPAEVVAMLNRYFAIALPAILEQGGQPIQLAGDSVMAVFGAPHAQADHAARGCRAALTILKQTERLATDAAAPGPRFHIGLNSGPALVGNIGSEEYRNFTAIGDTTNLAARLQDLARPGEAVIGPTTAASLDGEFGVRSLGHVTVKGRVEPTEAFALRAV
jgi:class 3 adenylate cyclase